MGDSKKQKQYLTGTVHRLHEGVLESLHAGDEAPDWVTNPAVLTDVGPNGDQSANSTPPTSPTRPTGSTENEITDDLTDLNGKALAEIAGELGLKKTGSKAALTAAIRAKRAESAPAPAAEEDAERAALIESLKAKGVEVDESLTEAELAALAEAQE